MNLSTDPDLQSRKCNLEILNKTMGGKKEIFEASSKQLAIVSPGCHISIIAGTRCDTILNLHCENYDIVTPNPSVLTELSPIIADSNEGLILQCNSNSITTNDLSETRHKEHFISEVSLTAMLSDDKINVPSFILTPTQYELDLLQNGRMSYFVFVHLNVEAQGDVRKDGLDDTNGSSKPPDNDCKIDHDFEVTYENENAHFEEMEAESRPGNYLEGRIRPSEVIKQETDDKEVSNIYQWQLRCEQSSQYVQGQTHARRRRCKTSRRSSGSSEYEYNFDDDHDDNDIALQRMAVKTLAPKKKKLTKYDSDSIIYHLSEHSSVLENGDDSLSECESRDRNEGASVKPRADQSLAVHCHICQRSLLSRSSLRYHMFLDHGIYNESEDGTSSEYQAFEIVTLDKRFSLLQTTNLNADGDLNEPKSRTEDPISGASSETGLNTVLKSGNVAPSQIGTENDTNTTKAKIRLEITLLSPDRFLCPMCDMMLETNFGVKRHIYKQHLMKNSDKADEFLCPDCGKVLPTIRGVRRHMEVEHTKEKSMCNICGKLCRCKSALKTHIKGHCATFRCDRCPRVFNQKKSLAVHLMSHDKIKDFICDWPDCGRRFASKWSLQVHVRRHTGEKPLRCNHCSYACTQRNALNFHQKSKHRHE